MRLAVLALALVCALPASAADVPPNTFRGEIIELISSGARSVPGTGITTEYQNFRVRLLEGEREGQVVEVEDTTSAPLQVGDRLYVQRLVADDQTEFWSAGEPDRVPVLVLLALVFVATTVLAGGMAGVRSLIALVCSFLVIIFGLVPALSSGAPPVLTSVALATVLLVASMLITHGANRLTLVALVGSVAALALSAVVAEASVEFARLSGFVSDEVVFLNFASGGQLDLSGLLLGSILIGVVGVLNDISVSQVHTTAELYQANPSFTRLGLLHRAMKVGREHLGAVVNTLPLAYAGASLPLLMIFSTSDASFAYIINREIFAAEIIRILSGGIALSLSGFVATLLAVWAVTNPSFGRHGIVKTHIH